jgi:hypothetical protein
MKHLEKIKEMKDWGLPVLEYIVKNYEEIKAEYESMINDK